MKSMIGTLVNVAAILAGGTLGLALKKGIRESIADTVMKGLGLCVLYIGISGSLKGENVLIAILSIAAGGLIGALCDLDGLLARFGQKIEAALPSFTARRKKSKSARSGQAADQAPTGQIPRVPIAQGFVSASLLFCVGAMAIVGSLQSGLSGNHEMLFTKSLLDGIAAIIFASTLGLGVLFSAAAVLLYQGAITLLAQFVAPFLTSHVVNEITCVGSLLIMAIGLNLLKITDLKIMNYLPALALPALLCLVL